MPPWALLELDCAGLGVHALHDCQRLHVKALLAQALAAGLEALLNRNADTFNRSASRFDNLEQAIERAGSKAGNKGYDSAMAAIEMVNLVRAIEG